MTVTPRLAHFVLQTNQLPAMTQWYIDVLGAHVVYENPAMCFLTTDEEHHRVALFGPPGGGLPERTPATVGLAHTAFTFPTLGDLIDKYLQLRDKGIEPRVPVQHGVTTSLYYRDPDGNMVELQIDNFATPEESTDYMHGEEYTTDTIGPSFNPLALAEAYKAGVPESELTTRAWALKTEQINVMERMLTP
uniref:Biphenyl-2,3-diol 1,2-dioxygenase 3 n=1 Tax=Rhodococcus globerulus TaxID=33008 RepID=BPHC3_RHOGO|nr:RecName: Full=Biphenyl-2,3-diol 1,2-dioxygenase 3; AltName: Full=2,3-dihydroxybiphenyl dioxygenase III; Short=DHBD III; AltName: Full=23OHBP oxygenase III; AltName: Full=Biphenyl-2,3-diol 1,2-dioxygenase III [Rhodococcus globerulus]CAA53299.1 2,3-dihydroxybiphenyl 1,2-dioxygenase III [Rhodococcus globerulus]